MGLYPLLITVACYLWVSIDLAVKSNYPMAGALLCYAIANVFLIWSLYW